MGHFRAFGSARDCLLVVVLAAAVAAAFAFLPGGAPAGSSTAASVGTRLIDPAFGAARSQIAEYSTTSSEVSGLRLASLPMDVTVDSVPAGEGTRRAAPRPADAFDQRFDSIFGERSVSFEERFAAVATDRQPAQRSARGPRWLASAEPLLETEIRERAVLAMSDPVADAPAGPQDPAAAEAAPSRPTRLAYAPSDVPLTEPANRTAIYDISRRVVYMPNGERLEAHSGLGEHMDDLSSFKIKNKGVTPPNIYKLSLREKLFHGVRAVRMTPVDPTKMHGRDGFLVHSYLLGPTGESNGCVSINEYPKFLNAFLKGEVDRLIVVERLENPPSSPEEPSGNWLADRIKALFNAS